MKIIIKLRHFYHNSEIEFLGYNANDYTRIDIEGLEGILDLKNVEFTIIMTDKSENKLNSSWQNRIYGSNQKHSCST